MNSVYNILDTIKTELRNTKGVTTVTFGNLSDIDMDKTTMFPLAHLVLGNTIHKGNTLEFTIKILCADIIDYNKDEANFDDFYQNDNLQDVLNTQFEVLNRLITVLKRGDLFKSNYQVTTDVVLEPFIERFSNLLAGWGVDISIQIPNTSTVC